MINLINLGRQTFALRISFSKLSSTILVVTVLFAMAGFVPAIAVPIDHGGMIENNQGLIANASRGKWGSPIFGTGASVSWSLMGSGLAVDGGKTSTALSNFMPTGFRYEIKKAFNSWSSIADIDFTQKPDPGVDWGDFDAYDVDIRISGHDFSQDNVLAHGYYPPVNFGPVAGDIHFDEDRDWVTNYSGPFGSYDIFSVAAHEIGHAIGLEHSDDPTALMATPYGINQSNGPQADDIAKAQEIYGAPETVPEPSTLALLLVMAPMLIGFLWAHNTRSAYRLA